MIFQANRSQMKAGVAIFISDEIKPKKVTRNKNGQYIMIKGTVHQKT